MDAVKSLTGLDDAWDDLDLKECRALVSDIRHELTDLEAEIAAAEERRQ